MDLASPDALSVADRVAAETPEETASFLNQPLRTIINGLLGGNERPHVVHLVGKHGVYDVNAHPELDENGVKHNIYEPL